VVVSGWLSWSLVLVVSCDLVTRPLMNSNFSKRLKF